MLLGVVKMDINIQDKESGKQIQELLQEGWSLEEILKGYSKAYLKFILLKKKNGETVEVLTEQALETIMAVGDLYKDDEEAAQMAEKLDGYKLIKIPFLLGIYLDTKNNRRIITSFLVKEKIFINTINEF